MHDYVLGFVCFMAGAFFVIAVGFISLGRMPLEARHSQDLDHPGSTMPPPPTDSERQSGREGRRRPPYAPDPHPPWPECDCPTEAFHFKYYAASGTT
jgi:hypothetical protein